MGRVMKYTLTVIDRDGKMTTVEVDADNDDEAQRLGEKYGVVIITASYDEPDWVTEP